MLTNQQYTRRRGVTLAQYGIIATLIIIVVISAIRTLGFNTLCMYHGIAHRLDSSYTIPVGCGQSNDQELVWAGNSGPTNIYTMGMANTQQSYTQSLPTYASSKEKQNVSYRLIGGTTLPNGLTLNTNGVITGTPSNNPENPAVTTTFQVQAYDGNSITKNNIYVTIQVKGKYIFQYTGSTQYFKAPSTLKSTTWKVWGAGGGGSTDNGSMGGAGGYVSGTIANTGATTIEVLVGGGGGVGAGEGAVGGGGPEQSGSQGASGSRGGGGSFVYINGQPEMVGGGGGGANGSTGAASGIHAGSGGGYNGGDGDEYLMTIEACADGAGDGGRGGTQTNGGTSGNGACNIRPSTYNTIANGSFGQGGTGVAVDNGSEGSGGGGYYGGGGGRDDSGDGFGGGGSGYVGNNSNVTTANGSGSNPGNSGDSDILPNIGTGAAQQQQGGNGEVVVSWGP